MSVVFAVSVVAQIDFTFVTNIFLKCKSLVFICFEIKHDIKMTNSKFLFTQMKIHKKIINCFIKTNVHEVIELFVYSSQAVIETFG